jgi:competence protein ComEC
MSKRLVYLVSLIFWILLSALILFWSKPKDALEVDFLDVGQGDAILIKTPFGQKILIDGGPSKTGVLRELAKNLPVLNRDIDLVILTHPHEDHLAGLLGVLERYQVKNIIYGSGSSTSALGEAWLKASQEEGAVLKKIGEEERIILGDGCYLEIVNPSLFCKTKDLNNYSLVSRLDCGGRWLFTGDIGSAAEKGLLTSGFDLAADVLKVAHHGSAAGNTEAFLRAVDPRTVVISAGVANSYGLPSPEILRRLKNFGANIIRTDQVGTIKMEFNRSGLSLRP